MWILFQITLIVSLVSGCVRYVPRPIDPPVLERSYRARTLADPSVEAFFREHSTVQPHTWPPQSMDLDALTVLALYFNPDLDEARARVAAADAAITSARVRPNPNALGGAGYTDAEQSPYAFRFDLEVPFERPAKDDIGSSARNNCRKRRAFLWQRQDGMSGPGCAPRWWIT